MSRPIHTLRSHCRGLLAAPLALALLGFGQARAAGAMPPFPSGAEIQVNAGTAAYAQTNPQVAVFPDGGFLVAWTVQAAANGRTVVHARLFASNGTPASGEYLLVNHPGSQAIDAVVAVGEEVVAAWEQRTGGGPTSVFAGRFQRSGRPIGAPVQVHPASTFNRYGGRVARDPSGGFAVSWTADKAGPPPIPQVTTSNIYMRRFLADGKPRGPQTRVYWGNPLGSEQPLNAGVGVAPDGTSMCAVEDLADSDDLFLYEIAADGAVTEIPGPLSPDFDNERDGNFAMAPDGSAVAAFSSGSISDNVDQAGGAVFAQTYDAGGAPQESLFQVNRAGAAAVLPQLAAMPGGAFVAAWTDMLGRDGDGFGVFGRAFGAGGTPITHDYQINETTAGDQIATSIAANAAGNIVIVWQSTTAPAFIAARRLAPPD